MVELETFEIYIQHFVKEEYEEEERYIIQSGHEQKQGEEEEVLSDTSL